MAAVLNPYATHLSNRNAQEVIAETPQALRDLLERLSPQGLERSYGPGKWSARQVFYHLADCEVVFGYRLRQTLGEAHHVIQPFDQDAWMRPYESTPPDVRMAIDTFAALRAWNLALIRGLSRKDFSKTVRHPERGDMTFETVVETMAGHDLHHMQHLERIAAA